MSAENLLFFLEPYTFIFTEKNKRVIYNTLNSAYIDCPSNVFIDELIDSLLLPENGYCIVLDRKCLNDPVFCDFVAKIKDSFSGDFVEIEKSFTKPYIFSPVLRYLRIDKQKDKDVSGREILKNLNEVSFCITGSCSQKCTNCYGLYKQIQHCTKNNFSDIKIDSLISLLDRLEQCDIGLVNFLGGNLFMYDDFPKLISYLKNYKIKKRFVLHYKNICSDIHDILSLDETKVLILIDSSFSNDSNLLKGVIEQYNNDNVEWCFIVESNNDVSDVEAIVEKHNINFNIKAFYNKKNLDFFEENIYLDFNDIIEDPISKETIFIRQTMNELFYGKLFFLQNGDVYSNLANAAIGNVTSETINEIVYKEINSSASWFNIRNKGVCDDCCNRWLCPSPSNYEIAIGRPNLCHVK